MKRMDKSKSFVTNGTSTVYMVILIGNILTNGVTPSTLKKRVKLNSLSKVETQVDKLYLAGIKNNPGMNNLSLTSKTSQRPEIFEQEAQSKMKITGHLSTNLSHSSKYNVKHIYDIHPTTVMDGHETFSEDTEDLTYTGNHLFFSDLYAKTMRVSIKKSNQNEGKEMSTTSMKQLLNHENLITPSLESYWASEALQTVGQLLKLDAERTQGYSKSNHSNTMLYLNVSQRVEPLSTENLSSLPSERFVSGQKVVFTSTEAWSHQNTDNRRSAENLKYIIPTMSLSVLSSSLENHPPLTYNTDSYFQPYSTVHTTEPTKSVPDTWERNQRLLSISRFIPRGLLFLNKHKNIYTSSNAHKHSVGKPPHSLPATSEQAVPSIGSKLPIIPGSDTATLNSDFGILPSVSIDTSDLYLNRVATPTLQPSANYITMGKTVQHQSTFDAHPYKTSEVIFSSKTLIEDNYQEQSYSSELRSQISVATLPASSEQTITSIESKFTDESGSETATLISNFGILPSVSTVPSSYMYLNRVATPTLKPSANYITMAKTIQHRSTFDAQHLKPTEGILSSKTLIEENSQVEKYRLWSSTKIYVATSLQNNETSSQRIPTPRGSMRNTENWTTVPQILSDLQNMNNINSRTESSEITKSFNIVSTPTLDSLSSVMLGLQPSYSQKTNEVATNYDLPMDSTIESDMSSRFLILQNTVNSVADSHIRKFTTEYTQYDHLSTYTTPDNAMMLSKEYPTSRYAHTTTEYPTSKQLMITESVLLGTEPTTSGIISSIYSTEKVSFSSDFQDSSSSVLPNAKFASHSLIRATSQYSTYLSSKYSSDDVETTAIHQSTTEETTDMKDIIVKTNGQEIKIEININNNIVNEDRKSTTATTSTTTKTPPEMPLELMVVCAYMCQQRGSPIPPFCGCTLQAWLR